MIFSNIPWRSISICSMFPAPRIETGAHGPAGQGDLDLAVLQLAGLEPGLHLLARPLPALGRLVGLGELGLDPVGRVRRGGQEQVEQPLLGPLAWPSATTFSRSRALTSAIAASTRSRTRLSTSRP